jgi:TRAP-type C4-dicarboxylate transport system permease small subunit
MICGFIAWHAVRFVQMDYEYGTEAFAGIPAWVTEVIIPIAFGLMALRYCLLILLPPRRARR